MAKRETITVYEHDKLRILDRGFTDEHFKRLVRWNEANRNKYFTVGYNSIHFSQYVGVIQVGDCVIEVLPKTDRAEADTDVTRTKWQRALLAMLRTVHDLPLATTTESHLQKRRSSVLDFFFGLFVTELEDLVRRGLVKRYRRTKENCTALKGRLDFPRHLQQNFIHQEHFFVEHQVYDTDHLLHALLKRALSIVKTLTQDPDVNGRAKGIEWAFVQVSDRHLDPNMLERIILNRKTEPYARATQLAKMIVQNYAPDMAGGHMPLIGLMFDMNVLFEKFVLRLFQKVSKSSEFEAIGLSVHGQRSRAFWDSDTTSTTIRPDILIEYSSNGPKRVIVDTKWKVPTNGKPNSGDLQQMFVYNVQLGSAKSVLLYPHVPGCTPTQGSYASSLRLQPWQHHCWMEYADLFDQHGFVNNLGAAVTLKSLIALA